MGISPENQLWWHLTSLNPSYVEFSRTCLGFKARRWVKLLKGSCWGEQRRWRAWSCLWDLTAPENFLINEKGTASTGMKLWPHGRSSLLGKETSWQLRPSKTFINSTHVNTRSNIFVGFVCVFLFLLATLLVLTTRSFPTEKQLHTFENDLTCSQIQPDRAAVLESRVELSPICPNIWE